MASPSKSLLNSLLVVALLAGLGGLLTSVESQDLGQDLVRDLAECGKLCGGFAMRMCVKDCHCVLYKYSDIGECLPLKYNETYLPEMRVSREGVQRSAQQKK